MREHCGSCVRLSGTEARPFAFPEATEHYAADRPVRAEHVRLEVALDFERREVAGTCTTRVRAVRELDALSFDAVDLEVEWATVDDRRVDFTSSGRRLLLSLPRPLSAEESAEVAIRYRCRPTRGVYFWGPDEAYPDRPVQAWTQGQDEDARAWFPCLDAPAQKASTEVIATFPATLTAVSNGTLVGEEVRGEERTVHYRLDFPHAPYLVTLVVGALEETVVTAGETRLRYLYPAGRKEDALRVLGRTPQMLAVLEDVTGERYPFGTYTQVFATEFIFGGMENTSATTLTDLALHDARAQLDFSAEPLVAHELAHQWFGDLLTCRDWPHGWLNEGFATYCEVLWKERSEGQDEADQHRREALDDYLEEVSSRYARPIVARRFAQPVDLFDRHLYEKGALVLHELRRRLGDALFFKALRHYVAKHRARWVETVDFARAIEEATGHNLDSFFDQYVHSTGHPALEVEARYEPEGKRVRLHVRQTQKTGEGGWPVFRLPLEVRLVCEGRATRHTVELTGLDHVFYFPAPKEPSQLLVDPRREALCTLKVDKPVACWLEELAKAPEARARVEAALALGKAASLKAVEALAAGLAKDPFWAVQAACAKALGVARTPLAKRALLENLAVAHPKARRAVVKALGDFRRDEEVARALRRVCERGDPSYFVEGEAARSLGRVRAGDSLELLAELTQRRSFSEAVACGAVDGMAETLSPEAYPRVEALTRYGVPAPLRRAAVVAVAKLAEPAGKKREAIDLLSAALRDVQFRVQMASFDAIRELGDRRMIEPLETTPLLDGRARRAARETLVALREGAPREKELASLREEVDRLKEETRGLKERLEAMSLPKSAKKPAARPKGGKRRR